MEINIEPMKVTDATTISQLARSFLASVKAQQSAKTLKSKTDLFGCFRKCGYDTQRVVALQPRVVKAIKEDITKVLGKDVGIRCERLMNEMVAFYHWCCDPLTKEPPRLRRVHRGSAEQIDPACSIDVEERISQFKLLDEITGGGAKPKAVFERHGLDPMSGETFIFIHESPKGLFIASNYRIFQMLKHKLQVCPIVVPALGESYEGTKS